MGCKCSVLRCRNSEPRMSARGRVSRVSSIQTAIRNCTRDEGRSFEAGSQVLASNHCKLLSSKAMVVSVAANVGRISRRVRLREASASEPPINCRKRIRRCQNRGATKMGIGEPIRELMLLAGLASLGLGVALVQEDALEMVFAVEAGGGSTQARTSCWRRPIHKRRRELEKAVPVRFQRHRDRPLVIARPGTNLAAEHPIGPRRISDDHRQQEKRADEEKRLRAGCGGRIPQTD